MPSATIALTRWTTQTMRDHRAGKRPVHRSLLQLNNSQSEHRVISNHPCHHHPQRDGDTLLARPYDATDSSAPELALEALVASARDGLVLMPTSVPCHSTFSTTTALAVILFSTVPRNSTETLRWPLES